MQNFLKQVSKHKWKYSLVLSKCIIIGSQTIREREREERGGESINTFMCPCDRWHLSLEEYFHFAGNYRKPALQSSVFALLYHLTVSHLCVQKHLVAYLE